MARILLLALLACPLFAERADVRGTLGWAAFPDDGILDNHHFIAGGGARLYLTRRLGFEPEFLYMRQSSRHRDYYFVPNATFDITKGRVSHYLIGGVGVFLYSPSGGINRTFGGGYGVKVYLTDRVFVAPEFRIGWEPFVRATVNIGYSFGGK